MLLVANLSVKQFGCQVRLQVLWNLIRAQFVNGLQNSLLDLIPYISNKFSIQYLCAMHKSDRVSAYFAVGMYMETELFWVPLFLPRNFEILGLASKRTRPTQ